MVDAMDMVLAEVLLADLASELPVRPEIDLPPSLLFLRSGLEGFTEALDAGGVVSSAAYKELLIYIGLFLVKTIIINLFQCVS